MYDVDRQFLKENCNYVILRNELETVKQCALNDLIAGDCFSDCKHCTFKDGLEFDSDYVLCNRYIDFCVK